MRCVNRKQLSEFGISMAKESANFSDSYQWKEETRPVEVTIVIIVGGDQDS